MNPKDKIKFMITALQIALEELEYAEEYKKAEEKSKKEREETGRWDYLFYDKYKRTPNGTLVRETLRNVARLAPKVADDVLLGKYQADIYREN